MCFKYVHDMLLLLNIIYICNYISFHKSNVYIVSLFSYSDLPNYNKYIVYI